MIEVEVRGQYLNADGSPTAGRIKFTPRVTVVSTVDDVVQPVVPVYADLDSEGRFTVDLRATDDPGAEPSGWTYAVRLYAVGGAGGGFDMAVPASAAGTGIDIADVTPAQPATGDVSAYVTSDQLVAAVAGLEGEIDAEVDAREALAASLGTAAVEDASAFDPAGSAAAAQDAAIAAVWAPAPSGGDDAPMLRALMSVPNAVIRLREGTYLLASKRGITEELKNVLEPANGVRLIGQGRGVTILKADDSLPNNSPLIRATDPSDIEICDLTIDGNKQRITSGVGVQEDEGINWKGTCTRVVMRNLHIHDTGQDCIDFDTNAGADPDGLSEGVVIDNCLLEDAGGTGIHGGCRGLVLTRTIIRNNCFERFAAGVTPYGGFDPTEDDMVVADCEIYGNAARQLVIDGQLRGVVRNMQVRNTRIVAQTGTAAVLMQFNVSGAKFTDCHITGADDAHAFQGTSGSDDTMLEDCTIVSSSITHNAVNITGNRTRIRGCDVTGGYRGASLNGNDCVVQGNTWRTQTNASLHLSAGTGALVQGNAFKDSPAGKSLILTANGGHYVLGNQISYGLSGFTGNFVSGNRGLVTENRGSGSMGAGVSFLVVSHGLGHSGSSTGVQPSAVVVTPRSNVPMWVSSRSTASFTVTRSDTTATVDFDWYAAGP